MVDPESFTDVAGSNAVGDATGWILDIYSKMVAFLAMPAPKDTSFFP